MQNVRRILDNMGYCHFCNKPGRSYFIGAAGRFLQGRGRTVLCEVCWLEVQPLIQPMHRIHRYQRQIKMEIRRGNKTKANYRSRR